MRSLRTRLIAAFAVVALVPLALAMLLLTDRIERTVEAEAGERLDATLGGIRARVAADGGRMAARLEILARDPALRRLVLVRPVDRRALDDLLAERRFLLGLDFLEVADTSGAVEGLRIERRVAGLAMAASAPIRYQGEPAAALRGGQLFDRAFLTRIGEASGVELLLRDAAGRPAAATFADSASIASAATGATLPPAGGSYRTGRVPLAIGPPPHPEIVAFASTAAAERTVATLRLASALLALLALGLAVLLGALWSAQIARPVERLAAFADRVAQGRWDEPLEIRSVQELERLVVSLDRMRRDLAAYRDRLVVSERQAAWSQMARKVAHEIKNPLTPIAVSIADVKRSYELNRPEFPQILNEAVRTVAEEIERLKRLVQEFSDLGRFPEPRLAPCTAGAVLADLETLHRADVASGRLRFEKSDGGAVLEADAGQLRQALLNLIRNGLEAAAPDGIVEVAARAAADHVEIEVRDRGAGLTPEQRAQLFVPGFTTKPEGSGLGLTIVERIVSDHGGTIGVESEPGVGTRFRIRLPRERAAVPIAAAAPRPTAAPDEDGRG